MENSAVNICGSENITVYLIKSIYSLIKFTCYLFICSKIVISPDLFNLIIIFMAVWINFKPNIFYACEVF